MTTHDVHRAMEENLFNSFHHRHNPLQHPSTTTTLAGSSPAFRSMTASDLISLLPNTPPPVTTSNNNGSNGSVHSMPQHRSQHHHHQYRNNNNSNNNNNHHHPHHHRHTAASEVMQQQGLSGHAAEGKKKNKNSPNPIYILGEEGVQALFFKKLKQMNLLYNILYVL